MRSKLNRHALKAIRALEQIEADKRRIVEQKRQEDLAWWAEIDRWWKWAGNILNRHTVQNFIDILEDRRDWWLYKKVIDRVFAEIPHKEDQAWAARSKILDDVFATERQEYLKVQRILEATELPTKVPSTEHYIQAAEALRICYIEEKRNNLLNLVRR